MLTFDPLAHAYTLDGQPVPSVTQVLRDSGLIDFSRIPEPILEAARARGTRVHQAIQFLNEGDLDLATVDEADRPYLAAWEWFKAHHRAQVLRSEIPVYSRRHGYAGTADFLAFVNGRLVLGDYKTGNPEDVATDLQTGAYVGAIAEMVQDGALVTLVPTVRLGVHLKLDGTATVETYQDPTDYTKFLALLTARRIVQQRKPKFFEWLDGAA